MCRYWLSAILVFKFFSVASLKRVKMHYCTEFNGGRQTVADLWRFNVFKMTAVRHLGFLKLRILNGQYSSDDQCASSCIISWLLVKPLLRYGDFSIFQNGGRPPSWIFQNSKCYPRVGLRASKCINMPSFLKIDRTLTEKRRFNGF